MPGPTNRPGSWPVGRQPYGFRANEDLPGRPLTMPGPGRAPYAVGYPGTLAVPSQIQRVIDPTHFQNYQSQYQSHLNGDLFELLAEPQNSRVYLYIRVNASSVGSLGIGINQQPPNLDQANWVLGPGDILPFESNVLRDDMGESGNWSNAGYLIKWHSFKVKLLALSARLIRCR